MSHQNSTESGLRAAEVVQARRSAPTLGVGIPAVLGEREGGPKRIQLRRVKGYRKPARAIVVRRPTKWGNPHDWRILGYEEAVRRFEADLLSAGVINIIRGKEVKITLEDARRDLRGHDLACTCALDHPCHADILLRVANEETGL
jgi:hypothetical protein